MQTFQGKVAVVTGAASGMGRALGGRSAQGAMTLGSSSRNTVAPCQGATGRPERHEAQVMKRGVAVSTVDGSGAEEFSLGRQVVRLVPSFIYSAVIPVGIYLLATDLLHLGHIPALLLAAVSPVAGTVIDFLRTERQVSVLGVFGFAGLVVAGVSALLLHSPRLILVSGSMMNGMMGLLMLGSVVIGQPLIVALALHGVTSAEARLRMKERLMAQSLHRHLQVLTVMWGLGLLLLLAASVVLTFTLPLTTVIVIGPFMGHLAIVGLLACTAGYRWYYMRRQAQRRGQAGQTSA
jgi:intracellular septation protein A